MTLIITENKKASNLQICSVKFVPKDWFISNFGHRAKNMKGHSFPLKVSSDITIATSLSTMFTAINLEDLTLRIVAIDGNPIKVKNK